MVSTVCALNLAGARGATSGPCTGSSVTPALMSCARARPRVGAAASPGGHADAHEEARMRCTIMEHRASGELALRPRRISPIVAAAAAIESLEQARGPSRLGGSSGEVWGVRGHTSRTSPNFTPNFTPDAVSNSAASQGLGFASAGIGGSRVTPILGQFECNSACRRIPCALRAGSSHYVGNATIEVESPISSSVGRMRRVCSCPEDRALATARPDGLAGRVPFMH